MRAEDFGYQRGKYDFFFLRNFRCNEFAESSIRLQLQNKLFNVRDHIQEGPPPLPNPSDADETRRHSHSFSFSLFRARLQFITVRNEPVLVREAGEVHHAAPVVAGLVQEVVGDADEQVKAVAGYNAPEVGLRSAHHDEGPEPEEHHEQRVEMHLESRAALIRFVEELERLPLERHVEAVRLERERLFQLLLVELHLNLEFLEDRVH